MTAFGWNIHFLAIIWMHRSHLFHAVALSGKNIRNIAGKTYCAIKSLPLYFFQCWNLLATAQISEQSLTFSLINHIQRSWSTACKAFCFVSTEQRQYYNNKTHSHDKLRTWQSMWRVQSFNIWNYCFCSSKWLSLLVDCVV